MTFWTDKNKSTEEIAQDLLGCLLVKETQEGKTSGWIVETEAYLGEIDEAAHSFGKKNTPRLASMYKEAGTIYIYSMHTHQMMNLVVQEAGVPEAILIRAIEPFEGIPLMEERRQKNGYALTDGPGKLTKALNIDSSDNGSDIMTPPLFVLPKKRRVPRKVDITPRIGIPNKGIWTEALLRYKVAGNPYVSKRKGEIAQDFGWNENFYKKENE